jgi:3-isopropylmalate dehydrogenase
MKKRIAVLSGDGIGPEVMQQTLRVLNCIAEKFDHHFEYVEGKIGGQAFSLYQSHLPDETLRICQSANAILFGSVGGPVDQQHLAKWQHCEVNSILKLRKHFNLSINIRPISVFPELAECSPLQKNKIKDGINLIIFRELTGGIYFGEHKQQKKDTIRTASDSCIYDEAQVKTIAHSAFQAAMGRNKKVCSVDKANVLATSKLWREVVNEVASHYPEVELTHMLVDNCAMQMILNPQQFDVIVTENMFGDILSDLAAALPGSLGLIPSASMNADGLGLYEPSGGSAPEIAGQGIANPCAQLLSAAMMLRHSFEMVNEAALIEAAIKSIIAQGIVTADLTNDESKAKHTSQLTDCIIEYIETQRR